MLGIELLIVIEGLQLPAEVSQLVELPFDLFAWQFRRDGSRKLSEIVEAPRNPASPDEASEGAEVFMRIETSPQRPIDEKLIRLKVALFQHTSAPSIALQAHHSCNV